VVLTNVILVAHAVMSLTLLLIHVPAGVRPVALVQGHVTLPVHIGMHHITLATAPTLQLWTPVVPAVTAVADSHDFTKRICTKSKSNSGPKTNLFLSDWFFYISTRRFYFLGGLSNLSAK
jgi:hypothetical protein